MVSGPLAFSSALRLTESGHAGHAPAGSKRGCWCTEPRSDVGGTDDVPGSRIAVPRYSHNKLPAADAA